jgi:hypothetical protein
VWEMPRHIRDLGRLYVPLDATDVGTAFWPYLTSLRNDGLEPCAYDFRVWVP